ncbi:hypothetical protein ACPCBX_09360 [Streptomyces tuirus]|nr:hypothetical protein [Streptomyces tuirus]
MRTTPVSGCWQPPDHLGRRGTARGAARDEADPGPELLQLGAL